MKSVANVSLDLSNLSSTSPLLILDLANNHNGSLEHGKQIIDEIALSVKDFPFQVAVKFQYRDLPQFIHPSFQSRRDLKYVDRFLSTQLQWENFLELRNYIKDSGLLAACTPFDEFSVGKVIEHKFDILKIASASFTDWSLLESVVRWEGPIIASTAGVKTSDIDRVVSFFQNRKKDFVIMHCVAAYPTTDSDLVLSRIRKLIKRYPNVSVGYSTHESPSNMMAGPLALAAGAVVLERHVGSTSDGNQLNGYSSDQRNLTLWLQSLKHAVEMLGNQDQEPSNPTEVEAIRGLRRYAFVSKDVSAGHILSKLDYYFAIPGKDNQLQANDIGKYVNLKTKFPIREGEALTQDNIEVSDNASLLIDIRNSILAFVEKSRIDFPTSNTLEVSHHYGISDYYSFGLAMVTLINLDYCKKYLILLAGQKNPAHYHKEKDETFFLLSGSVWVKLDESEPVLVNKGQTLRVKPGVVHEFWTEDGCIIEELSTKHVASDSYYVDPEISSNEKRKSFISYWAKSD